MERQGVKALVEGIVMTASPEFVTVAMEEVRDLEPGQSPELKLLGEGVFFWRNRDPLGANRLLLAKPPIFLHHLHRAVVWDYVSDEELQATVCRRLFSDLQSVPVGSRVALQGRSVSSRHLWQPRELKSAVDAQLAELGFIPTVKEPGWVISVTQAGEQVYYGLSPVEQNLSNWTGGMVHFRKGPGDISRSNFKLLEAITRFDLSLPQGGTALDLGAAPGGWTRVLLDRGMRVIAVDTGELDSRLVGQPGLTFLQRNVNELTLPATTELDVLTCDMSWDPFFTVRAVNRLSERLKSGGQVLLTVKLMGRRPRQTARQVIEALNPRLALRHAQHLFHNRQEITLHLQRV